MKTDTVSKMDIKGELNGEQRTYEKNVYNFMPFNPNFVGGIFGVKIWDKYVLYG